jgi:hypothetical protein
LPWSTGNTWTYRTTLDGVASTKVTTVGDMEPVGGSGPNQDVMALKVVTSKADGTDTTESWQADVGDKVVRYRERAYHANSTDLELEEHWDPYKLHVDGSPEHLVAAASWLETYEETKLPVGGSPVTATARDRWFVDVESEEVTVPAGTFDAVVLRKVGGSEKRYWYVRGIGKVKETGGQVEELVSWSTDSGSGGDPNGLIASGGSGGSGGEIPGAGGSPSSAGGAGGLGSGGGAGASP